MARIRLVTASVQSLSRTSAKAAIVHLRIPAEGAMPDHTCVAQNCDECLRRLKSKAARKGIDGAAEVTILRDRFATNEPPVVHPITVA